MILSLETTASTCSVALHKNGSLVKAFEVVEPQQHASQLTILIDRLFQETSLSPNSIAAVSVSSGPGSYTGVRIGTSTAKGICFALKTPLISIPTLDLLCHQAVTKMEKVEGLLCPMIDAKRMEVYYQVVDGSLKQIHIPAAAIIDETSFRELLDTDKMFFFGDGSSKCKSIVNHLNAVFIDGINPSAEKMGELSFDKFSRGRFEDLVNFVPFYLKDFIAKKAPSLL